jgi:hypothetical protein
MVWGLDWSSDDGLLAGYGVGLELEWLCESFDVLFVDEDSGDILDFLCRFLVVGGSYDFHIHEFNSPPPLLDVS